MLHPSRGNPLKRPRGVLPLSPSGCGKSQFCKLLGNEVGRPVLTLDVGSLMGSLVGQSEERTRQALRVIDAMAPCVAMIDEVEKAFARLNGDGDSGVSSRMFGQFLGWLNDLFDVSDYPASLVGLFAIEHDYPSIEPPNYLRQLSPKLYEAECQRVQARFDEAVQLAEAAFMEELAKLVDHLAGRLNGDVDGKPKVFRDTAITNMTEFFERFRALNVRSN